MSRSLTDAYNPTTARSERSGSKVESEERSHAESAPRCIAIDGPSAAGKSAVGARVARHFGCLFIDTGMMYRALTWLALERKIDLHDEAALARLAETEPIDVQPGPPEAPEAGRVSIGGADVTDRLRSTEVGGAVSLVSRVPKVREAMVALQRELAGRAPVVMAGRDIGTVVLPDAPLKVYLEASPDERVRRRHDELLAKGTELTEQQVRDELALRDAIDSERAVSPLRPAEDAIIIDTDRLSLDEVVARILELASCS